MHVGMTWSVFEQQQNPNLEMAMIAFKQYQGFGDVDHPTRLSKKRPIPVWRLLDAQAASVVDIIRPSTPDDVDGAHTPQKDVILLILVPPPPQSPHGRRPRLGRQRESRYPQANKQNKQTIPPKRTRSRHDLPHSSIENWTSHTTRPHKAMAHCARFQS
jgi:hypothetical protein